MNQRKIDDLEIRLKSRIVQKEQKKKVPFKSVEELDAKVNSLQAQVDTGTMKLVDEKKALAEISNLHQVKKSFGTFAEADKSIAYLKQQIADIKKSREDPEVKALSDRYTAIQKELDALKAERTEQFKSDKGLFDEICKVTDEQQEKRANLKHIKDAYFQASRAYKDYEREAMKVVSKKDDEEEEQNLQKKRIQDPEYAFRHPLWEAWEAACAATAAPFYFEPISVSDGMASDLKKSERNETTDFEPREHEHKRDDQDGYEQDESDGWGGRCGDEYAEDDDVGSEMSFGHESVFSVAATVTTSTSFSVGELDDFLIQELANFLWEDSVLHDLYSVGLHDAKIGRDRFQRNFRRLLKQFALDLKLEATDREQFRAANFISNQSGAVSREICVRVAGPKKTPQIPRDQEDSSNEEAEDPPSEDEEYSLSQVKQFILSSFAFAAFRDNLRNFVQPTLQSKFGELIRVAKGQRALPHCHVQDNWIRTCLSEVRCIDPSMVEISRGTNDSWTNNFKIFVENWTRQRWDWWPFVPAQHPLDSDQVRLKWLCVSFYATM